MSLGDIGNAAIRIRPNMAGFDSALAIGTRDALKGIWGELGSGIADAGKSLLTNFALPLGAALVANTAQWAALDKEIRNTVSLFGSGGLSGVVEQQFGEMRGIISGISEELGVMEQGISQGLYQAISAGIPRDNVFEFLETAQKSAIGGSTDLLTAVDGLTSGLNAFGLEAEDAVFISDVMFRAVARGKTTFGELSNEMAKVAPIVAGAGVSFEEFLAVAATMTLQGTSTAETMTNIKAAMTGLLRPSEEMTAIWEEAGFASGDLAVQSLGLQGAMSVVADATGGATSELIKLLGGAEAANAVLQVTGANAETFVSVLNDTSTAAGATGQAFDTMQSGISRSFGSLTAAFDRLGSRGGELASGFVQPIVDALTTSVSTFANWTSTIGDALEPVADLFGSFIRTVFDNPIVANGVSLFATLAVSIAAVGTALGGTLLVAGSAIALILGPNVLFRFRLLVGALKLVNTAVAASAVGLVTQGQKLIAVGGLAEAFGRKLTGAGESMGKLLNLIKPGPFLAISAAIGVGVVAFAKLREQQEKWREDVKLTTTGADLLADSLGLVTKDLLSWPDSVSTTVSVKVLNDSQIDELRRILNTFGPEAAQDQAFILAFRYKLQGNTPEASIDAVQTLIDAGGLDIPLSISPRSLTDVDQYFDTVTRNTEALLADFKLFEETAFFKNPLGPGFSKAEGNLQEVGELVAEMFVQFRDPGVGFGALEQINKLLDPTQANIFNDAVLEALGGVERFDTAGPQLGIADRLGLNTTDFEDMKAILDEAGFSIEEFAAIPSKAFGSDYQRNFRRAGQSVPEIRSVFERFTEDNLKDFNKLADGMGDAMGEAERYVEEATSKIRDSFLQQMPILDIYTGAIKQSFAEWRTGQQTFRTDLSTWQNEVLPILKETLNPDLVSLIDAKPLEAKAWLTQLGLTPDGFEITEAFQSAMDEMQLTFDLTGGLADNEVGNQWASIIEGGRQIISNKYDELIADAAEAGTLVALAFSNAFSSAAGVWGSVAGEAGNLFITSLEKTYQVKSPSKVMMDIAHNVADGFKMGIESRKDDFSSPDISLGGSVSSRGGSGGSGEMATQLKALIDLLSTRESVNQFTFAPVNPTTKDLDADARRFARVLRIQQTI